MDRLFVGPPGATVETCRVCGTAASRAFSQQLLGRLVAYYDCPRCGYLQTESPYWLEEAYSQPINDVDTGIVMRNRLNVDRVIATLTAYRQLSGRVVDFAGGCGLLVRMLRDAGVDAWWQDRYCENLLARGFEAQDAQRFDLATAFEVFEHLVDPLQELQQLLARAPVVLLSTELVPSREPLQGDWWYLGPEHGQHIGFFRPATLRWMAERLKVHTSSHDPSLHVFSRAPVPRLWNVTQRLRRCTPILKRIGLKSKTMLDFEQLRRQRRGPA